MGKYEDFIKLANGDLRMAKVLLNSANDEIVQNGAAYHTQQAVEKIMKGLIVKAGSNPGVTHNITQLAKDLAELKIQYPEWINDKDDDLSSWATTIRYNADFKTDHDEIEETISQAIEWLESI